MPTSGSQMISNNVPPSLMNKTADLLCTLLMQSAVDARPVIIRWTNKGKGIVQAMDKQRGKNVISIHRKAFIVESIKI